MRLLLMTTCLACISPAFAQDITVLPGSKEQPPSQMLHRFLQAEAKKHFDGRRAEVATLQTPSAIQQRQATLKQAFLNALGPLPKKTPLNAKVTGTKQMPGYRVEKVIYESQPQHHVTANLYLPDGKGPFPGVLIPCGHSANGKAAVPYQSMAISLAQHGIAALCYDPIGQGERLQSLDSSGKPAVKGSTSEHTEVGLGALLVGRCCATYRIWDGIRSLDYLASRPEVDAKRLGCTGNSGGGTLTAYLMALDERIMAAAPSCYITTLEKLFATIGPQDAEQNIPGQVAFGLEHADYVTLRAPLPTLICVGTQDFFNIDGAWTTYREAKLLYGTLGYGERVSLFEFNDKHGFSQPRRQAALRWMRRWLLQKDDAVFEKEMTTCSDAELQCTRTGQVLMDYQDRSVYHLNAELAKQLTPKRAAFNQQPPEEKKKIMRQLLGLPETIGKAAVKEAGTTRRDSGTIHKLIFTTEAGIQLPALWYAPAQPNPERTPLLVLHERGAAFALGQAAGLRDRHVLFLEVRGMGETTPGAAKSGFAKEFGPPWKEAFLGLHLNRPLLGQRVQDVVSILQALPFPVDRVELTGVGEMGPVVLHAALFEPRIATALLQRSLVSWHSVVETPLTANQIANVVPGALRHYDLSDLVGWLGSQRVRVEAPVDARGERLGAALKRWGRGRLSAQDIGSLWLESRL